MAKAKTSLRGSVKAPQAAQDAAEIARKIAGKTEEPAPQDAAQVDLSGLSETVSYNLPVEMIEEIAELAALRLKLDKQNKRAARLKGQKPPQARRSASAVVREALEAHRPKIRKEIEALKAAVGIA